MILQRIRIQDHCAGVARFEPGTLVLEVWCSTYEPLHLPHFTSHIIFYTCFKVRVRLTQVRGY